MQQELGFSDEDIQSKEFLLYVTGNANIENSKPFAMCYAGHQFGNWAGQLGDGRAINLGEIKNWALQLKGAGPTPYSRTADGLAVLRSSIREYLCSEAMHHLGVPSTRALSLSLSGDQVLRDVLYNGNPAYEKGAIVSRVAKTFLRFGNFELFAARNDLKNLKILADYTIKSHFSHLGNPCKEVYLKFFQEITNKTLEMIIHWQRVGFVHGVMNTDNMSILGLTIDYGPFSFMEAYDPGFICNHSDTQGRYSFERQPSVALWNLHRLADTLKTLIEEEQLKEALSMYEKILVKEYSLLMRNKFGFAVQDESDNVIINNFLELLYTNKKDYHQSIRLLSNDDQRSLGKAFDPWFKDYHKRLKIETENPNQRCALMNKVNPKYILRNYLAEVAIRRAEDHNEYAEIDSLFKLLRAPFEEHEGCESYDSETPEWAQNLELSCSS